MRVIIALLSMIMVVIVCMSIIMTPARLTVEYIEVQAERIQSRYKDASHYREVSKA